MPRLARNKLRSFVSLKPKVWVGTAAAATRHLRKLQLVRWESALLHCILLLHFHIFNLPWGSDRNFYPLTRSTRRRLQLANFPSPGCADTAFLKAQTPGTNILKNNLKKWTYHKQQNISLSAPESTSPKGFQRLMELRLSICLRSFPAFWVLNHTAIDFGGELSDVDYQSSSACFSKMALWVGEVSLSCVFWGQIFSGCWYLETEGTRSSAQRYPFWMAFHFYSLHFLSNEATSK